MLVRQPWLPSLPEPQTSPLLRSVALMTWWASLRLQNVCKSRKYLMMLTGKIFNSETI